MRKYPDRRHLRVLDVMTTEVVTAQPSDGFKEVAERLYDTGVSGLPVVDEDGRVLGVVSEGDLLVKEGGEHKGSLLHPKKTRRLTSKGSLLHPKKTRRLTSKAEATVAAQAMTEPAVTITADATVAEAARVMYKKGVKRLPVLDSDGRLLGVVSRHDVIKVFVRSDASIRDEAIEGVLGRDLMIDTVGVRVEVEAGIVAIAGQVERRTDIPIITSLVSAMDGVVAVNNALTYRWDDTRVELQQATGP
jgi:CBS domain-containing protein